MDLFEEALPWYVAGPLIGLMVPLLMVLGNRQLGISGSVQDFCAWCLRRQAGFFRWDGEKMAWRLWFSLGLILAGVFLSFVGSVRTPAVSVDTVVAVEGLGTGEVSGLYPTTLLGGGAAGWSWWQVVYCVGAGVLVGFGTRYAGGCTSGHSIMGLAKLSPGSLVATVAFFVGGLVVTHLVFPFLIPFLTNG